MRVLLAFALLVCAAPAQNRPGSPFANRTGTPLASLPPNIEVMTEFGERADISPDNRRIAFMAKSFGDAFVIDIESRRIRCLTCNVPGAAFLRVMHLVTGDYILIGPERFKDIRTSRAADNELWFLSRVPGSKPVRLGQRLSEGAAVSKKSLRIAWSETSRQNPDLPAGSSRLVVAEIRYDGATPQLANRKVARSSDGPGCTMEAQDFYDSDRRLTFTCYQPNDAAAVYSIELSSGAETEQSRAAGQYNEVEGIFPDGLHTCVESDRQAREAGRPGGFRQIDIWKLRLDGTGKSFTRLTRFNDTAGWKASNPVVSSDGKFMAFQVAKSADEAGVGYGILMYRFR